MKKTIIIIHGSKEHIGRYEDFIEYLEINSINVVADDLFDHGKNLKGTTHDFSFDEMLNSALDMIDKANKLYPESEKIILGHSMGSFIVKYIVYNNLRKFDKVILSGTNNLSGNLLKIALNRTNKNPNKVSKINESLSYGWLSILSKLKGHGWFWGTSDENINKSFINDPLCGKDFTNQSLNAMFKFCQGSSDNEIFYNFQNKEIPQLLIYGKKDPVTNFGKDIKNLIRIQNKENINNHIVVEYKNSKHEILFDVDKENVYKDIMNFVKSQ